MQIMQWILLLSENDCGSLWMSANKKVKIINASKQKLLTKIVLYQYSLKFNVKSSVSISLNTLFERFYKLTVF